MAKKLANQVSDLLDSGKPRKKKLCNEILDLLDSNKPKKKKIVKQILKTLKINKFCTKDLMWLISIIIPTILTLIGLRIAWLTYIK